MPERKWPADWDERRRGKDCPLCARVGIDESDWGIRILTGRYTDVFLQRAHFSPGYAVALWKLGHVAEPTELTEDEAAGYWLEVLRVGRAIEDRFQPIKMNYEILGNTVPHLHTHLVPRYRDDANPGLPLPFTLMDSGTKVPEEELRADADALRQVLASAD
jgi:diadenosine tetraphosphate (Ap4A) HIT family hydrolase